VVASGHGRTRADPKVMSGGALAGVQATYEQFRSIPPSEEGAVEVLTDETPSHIDFIISSALFK
jgi:hypothetical protein